MITTVKFERHQKQQAESLFNPAHIRPSSAGSACLRAEALRILNALYPNNPAYIPPRPDGKKGINGTARLGHIIEESAVREIQNILNKQRRRAYPQVELPAPELKNPDGTPVVAHPDLYIPVLQQDTEIKSVSVSAIPRLPIEQHVDQHLLRLYWWKLSKGKSMTGVLIYFFRETYYYPNTERPLRYYLVWDQDETGLRLLDEHQRPLKHFPLDYLKEINNRLLTLKAHIDAQTLPERTESLNAFPCLVHMPKEQNLQIECPWRELCWAKELAEERDPGVIVEKAGELLQQYYALKKQNKAAQATARETRKTLKNLEQQLDAYLNQLGDKITAKGLSLKRTLVEMPEKTISGYSYYRYSLRKTS